MGELGAEPADEAVPRLGHFQRIGFAPTWEHLTDPLELPEQALIRPYSIAESLDDAQIQPFETHLIDRTVPSVLYSLHLAQVVTAPRQRDHNQNRKRDVWG